MDTLGFLLSKSSILPPIEAEKYKKKLMKEATGLKKDSMFDNDDYDPNNRYAYAFYLPPSLSLCGFHSSYSLSSILYQGSIDQSSYTMGSSPSMRRWNHASRLFHG